MFEVRQGIMAGGRRITPRLGLLVILLMIADTGLCLETSLKPVDDLVERSFRLRNRSVGEAFALIYPLLSESGTVFAEAGKNILTVKDRGEVLAQIEHLIKEMDQPASRVELVFQIVNAALGKSNGPANSGIPAELMVRLGELLRYRSFNLLAERKIAAEDQEEVRMDVGLSYHLRFRLQSGSPEERIRLEGFQLNKIGANSESRPLIHTHLDLRSGKPMILGLAKTESSPEALVVVINYRESDS